MTPKSPSRRDLLTVGLNLTNASNAMNRPITSTIIAGLLTSSALLDGRDTSVLETGGT
jgi:hypothetical protein